MSTPKPANVRFGAQSLAAASHALYTPHTPCTPAVSCVTPAPPPDFISCKRIHRDTDEFLRLQHRAVAINVERLEGRKDKAWRRSELTDDECFYLWCDVGGRCARLDCRKPLNETSMTVEHIIPQGGFAKGRWDLRNLTILCRTCNSKKKEFHINSASEIVMPSLVESPLMAAARGGARR